MLIGIALSFLTIFLFVPLAFVFAQAFAKGIDVYFAAIVDDDALAAIRLTLLAAAIAVPLNLVFGIAAACRVEATANGCAIPTTTTRRRI